MTNIAEKPAPSKIDEPQVPTKKRRSRWRIAGILLLILILAIVIVRLMLPSWLRSYVNRTIDQSLIYAGEIGDVDVHLWRGGYSIEDIKISKTTANVPVPFFAAKRVDLVIQWRTLLSGEVVGQIVMHQPELNFVDSSEESGDQTGAGGPWLEIIEDLFPFRINSAVVRDGSIHFRAFDTDPPVDLYLSQIQASIQNLTNIDDDIAPLIATVEAQALAMDHARLEYKMKLDPSSYKPTFQMAVRLLGLDVTKVNDLARAYGAFDFERGWFDLIIELDAKEGLVEGYVKPMFRDLKILSLEKDIPEDNVIGVFWEALVGVTTELLENQPRDQFATMIPLRGDLSSPGTDIFNVLGNVLYNAFVRAYLPRLRGEAEAISGLEFSPGSVTDPSTVGESP